MNETIKCGLENRDTDHLQFIILHESQF